MKHSLQRHVFLMLAMMLACSAALPMGAPDADNPDGVDPPQINPHPTQTIEVQVVAPSSLKISLYEEWSAPVWRGVASLAGPGLCSKDPEKPVPPGHFKRFPIALTRRSGLFRGIIVVDRYFPGRCDWGFVGVAADFSADSPPLIYSTSPNPSYPHQAEQIADIWCGTNPITTERDKFVCGDLSYFAKYSHQVPASLIAANPSPNGKLPSSILFVDSTTRSVLLRYHDLSAALRGKVNQR